MGAVHYCLNALAETGLIKLGNFQVASSKRGSVYLPTPDGIAAKAAMTVRFLQRKLAEYDALRAEIDELSREVGTETDVDQQRG